MKKVLMILVLLLITGSAFGAFIEILPDDPKCASDEKAVCTKSCMSTLLACGPYGTWENGEFKEIPYKECNTTTCSWNCICIKQFRIDPKETP